MEQRIQFDSDGLILEGLLDRGADEKGVVITHPHPHYGGDMNNSIVELIKNVARAHDCTTLRFNFRGTGQSNGRFDDGVGEQTDVRSAVSYLKGLGVKKVDLAGYSFGAWVIAGCFKEKAVPVDRVILVAPPIDFLEFAEDLKIPNLALVVCGDQDGFADYKEVKRAAALWNPETPIKVIPGADHFFSGFMTQLHRVLTPFLIR